LALFEHHPFAHFSHNIKHHLRKRHMMTFSYSAQKIARRVVTTMLAYALAASAVGYFVHQAHHGERGLQAKQELKSEMRSLEFEFAELKATKEAWGTKLSMLQDEGIEKDLLDERVRATLSRVHRSDVVVLTP
jgi:cell division protein FtsB